MYIESHILLWLVALFEPVLCNDSVELNLKTFVKETSD